MLNGDMKAEDGETKVPEPWDDRVEFSRVDGLVVVAPFRIFDGEVSESFALFRRSTAASGSSERFSMGLLTQMCP